MAWMTPWNSVGSSHEHDRSHSRGGEMTSVKVEGNEKKIKTPFDFMTGCIEKQ